MRNDTTIDASILPSPLPAGCVAAYYPQRALKSFAVIRDGVCFAILELAADRDWGSFRESIAGEIFNEGTVEPTGPFASAPSSRARVSFREWVCEKIRRIVDVASS